MSNRILPNRRRAPVEKRDWWDRAQIIISGFSSIALVGVGLYISNSLQNAQMSITEINNKAQLKLAMEKNAADIRLQELKSATDLMEPLLSSDSRKRQIALLMLPHSLSDEGMSHQILLIATSDPDPQVRVAALTKMSQSANIAVAAQLQKFSTEPSRPSVERSIASNGALGVSLRAFSPPKSAVFYAASPGGEAMESSEFNGGLFTYALLKSLSTSGQSPTDQVTLLRLQDYIAGEMRSASNGQFSPYVEMSASGDEKPFALVEGKKTYAIIVGVSSFADQSIGRLRYANSDAHKVATIFGRFGIESLELLDPTLEELRKRVKEFVSHTKQGDRVIFYYSGRGVMMDGESILLMSDSKVTDGGALINSALHVSDIQRALTDQNLDLTVLFLDVCRSSFRASEAKPT